MATTQTTPVLPGDLIQDHAGHFYMVTETHGWGVGAIQRWRTTAEDEREHYFRLREDEFFVCGTAAMLPQEVAELRAAAVQTQAELAREAAKATPLDDVTETGPPTIKAALLRMEMAGGRIQSIVNGGGSLGAGALSDLDKAQEALSLERAALHEAMRVEIGVEPDLMARILAL